MEDESWQKPWALCCKKFMEKRGSGNTQDLSWHRVFPVKGEELSSKQLRAKGSFIGTWK